MCLECGSTCATATVSFEGFYLRLRVFISVWTCSQIFTKHMQVSNISVCDFFRTVLADWMFYRIGHNLHTYVRCFSLLDSFVASTNHSKTLSTNCTLECFVYRCEFADIGIVMSWGVRAKALVPIFILSKKSVVINASLRIRYCILELVLRCIEVYIWMYSPSSLIPFHYHAVFCWWSTLFTSF